MAGSHATLESFGAEIAELRKLLTTLAEADWDRLTPADPWLVRDQVAHLAFVFDLATMAASDTDRFNAVVHKTTTVGFDAAVTNALADYNGGSGRDVLARFDMSVNRVVAALGALKPVDVVPWLVNPLPVQVLAAAGMTEVFAHGQDIADAVHATLDRTDRVRHLVEFAHRTVPFGYQSRDLPAPTNPFRFCVTLPSGARFSTGPTDAPNQVRGDAVDLVLLATRRRHLADLNVDGTGPDVSSYLEVAQAYRGPAGAGRQPQQEAIHHRHRRELVHTV